jgi:hypothetical protein
MMMAAMARNTQLVMVLDDDMMKIFGKDVSATVSLQNVLLTMTFFR